MVKLLKRAFNAVKPKGLIEFERSTRPEIISGLVDKKILGVTFNNEHPLGETDGVKVPISTTRTIMSWHHSISQVSGGLVVASGKKMISKKQITNWINLLRSVADQMGIFLWEKISIGNQSKPPPKTD